MLGLIEFLPGADALLDIEPEDLGLVLVSVVRGIRSTRNFTLSDVEVPLWNPSRQGYPYAKPQEVARALAEVWQWLQAEGLVMPDPAQSSGWFCLTRRGERLKSPAEVEAYRKGDLLPASNLQPLLLEKVRPMFLRGDYYLSVFEAFKQIKIAVRAATSSPAELLGTDLMRVALHADTGKLTDMTVVAGERQALSHLFAGAIGHAKNPGSHRTVTMSAVEAAQLIGFASYLLGIVETRSRTPNA